MCLLKFSGIKSVINFDVLYGEIDEMSYDVCLFEYEIGEVFLKFY